ncbi:helix-turn-helix domain-containing protein [Nocardia goodfellowii]
MSGQNYKLRGESTLQIAKGDRPDFWAERVQENQGRIGLNFDFGDTRSFNGWTQVQECGHDVLIEFGSTMINYRREPQHIRADDDRSGRLLIVREGSMRLTSGKDSAVLQPGEVGMYSMGREMDVAHDAVARAVVLSIPEGDPLASMLTEDAPIKVDRRRPMLAAAVGMVDSLVDHRETMTAQDFTHINAHLRQLVARSFDERQLAELSTLERIARDAFTYIQTNSDDPTLDPDSVAAQCCCSLSQLHKALRTVGTTPAKMLLDTRLQRAQRRLQFSTDSISQIAFASGFGGVNTFRDNFQKHSGMSPSQWRKRNAPLGQFPSHPS